MTYNIPNNDPIIQYLARFEILSNADIYAPVSYTHLTLPTIYSV